MIEFLHLIFNGANAIPTGLLLFIVLYWIIVIMGFLGTDFLDIDIDVEADLDADAEVEGSTSSSGDVSFLNNVLLFFNLGRMPLMIWLSFLVIPLWFINVNVTGFLGIENFFLGLLIFFPTLIACLFIAKLLTWPFMKFFQRIDKEGKKKEIIGKVGVVMLSADHLSKGQAEINYQGSFLRLSILTKEGTIAAKGSSVLFIQHLPEKAAYLIEPYNELN
jgi:hypothetical protein